MAPKCGKWALVSRDVEGRHVVYERRCNYGKVTATLQFGRFGKVHSLMTRVDGNPVGVKFGMDDEKSALRIAAGMATRRYGEE